MSFCTAPSVVTATAAASPAVAQAHYLHKLSLETDCADVHVALTSGLVDFTLLDVRGAFAYAKAHLPTAINLPRDQITGQALANFGPQQSFVVYCAGPHCNGADKAAAKIAGLGFPVKIMIGGMTGWRDEGFSFAGADHP